MHTIDRDKLVKTQYHFAVDASEAGLPPGEWPTIVEVVDTYRNGKEYFKFHAVDRADGEIHSALYKSPFETLVIFND